MYPQVYLTVLPPLLFRESSSMLVLHLIWGESTLLCKYLWQIPFGIIHHPFSVGPAPILIKQENRLQKKTYFDIEELPVTNSNNNI